MMSDLSQEKLVTLIKISSFHKTSDKMPELHMFIYLKIYFILF